MLILLVAPAGTRMMGMPTAGLCLEGVAAVAADGLKSERGGTQLLPDEASAGVACILPAPETGAALRCPSCFVHASW